MTRAYSSPEARAAVAKEFAEDTAAHRLRQYDEHRAAQAPASGEAHV